MIKYPSFSFATAPRTGSTWFMKACSMMGFGDGQKAKVHEPFPADWHSYTVSLVRHPYTWLESYYFALKGGSTGVLAVDQVGEYLRAGGSFSGFIHRYAEQAPGLVGKVFDSYKAATVLKLEDMPWAAIEFFESIGVDSMHTERLRWLTPQNSRKMQLPPDRHLKKLVVSVEPDLCERYEYY